MSTALGSVSGAINEEEFLASFEDVPKVQVCSQSSPIIQLIVPVVPIVQLRAKKTFFFNAYSLSPRPPAEYVELGPFFKVEK